jgi:hypothetical protein
MYIKADQKKNGIQNANLFTPDEFKNHLALESDLCISDEN